MKTQTTLETEQNRLNKAAFIKTLNDEFGRFMQQLIMDGESERFFDHHEFMRAAMEKFLADEEGDI